MNTSPRAAGPVTSRFGTQEPDVVEGPPGEGKEGFEGKPDGSSHALHLAEEGDEVVGGHARRGVVRAGERLRWDRDGPAAESGHDIRDELVPGNGEVAARSQPAGADEGIGQAREGVEQGDPFVCSEHVEAKSSQSNGPRLCWPPA